MPQPASSIQPWDRHTRHGSPPGRVEAPRQMWHSMDTSADGSVNGKKSGRSRTRSPSPNIASTNARIAPRRSAMVRPSSTARHSIWWNTGLCVASSASLRKHVPGLTTYSGSGRVSMARIWTGEVCVRSTMPEDADPSGAATNRVSCISRAGWSGGKLSASKLYHSASTSGPSAIS